jgi:hypothetical protein
MMSFMAIFHQLLRSFRKPLAITQRTIMQRQIPTIGGEFRWGAAEG